MATPTQEIGLVLAATSAMLAYFVSRNKRQFDPSQLPPPSSEAADVFDSDHTATGSMLIPPPSKVEIAYAHELNTSISLMTQGRVDDAFLSSTLYKKNMNVKFELLTPEVKILLAQWFIAVHGSLLSFPTSFPERNRIPDSGQVGIPELTRARNILSATFPYSLSDRRERIRTLLEINWKLQDVPEMKKHYDVMKRYTSCTIGEELFMFVTAAHIGRFDELIQLGGKLNKKNPALFENISKGSANLPAVFNYSTAFEVASAKSDTLLKISFNTAKSIINVKGVKMVFKTLNSKDRKSVRSTIRTFAREVMEYPIAESIPIRRSGALARIAVGLHDPQTSLHGFMNDNYMILCGIEEIVESNRKIKTTETLELVRDAVQRQYWRGVSTFEKEKVSGNVRASEEQFVTFDVEFLIDMNDGTFVAESVPEGQKGSQSVKPTSSLDFASMETTSPDALVKVSQFSTTVNHLIDSNNHVVPLDPLVISKKRIAEVSKMAAQSAPATPETKSKGKKHQ